MHDAPGTASSMYNDFTENDDGEGTEGGAGLKVLKGTLGAIYMAISSRARMVAPEVRIGAMPVWSGDPTYDAMVSLAWSSVTEGGRLQRKRQARGVSWSRSRESRLEATINRRAVGYQQTGGQACS